MTELTPKMLSAKNDLWSWLGANDLLTDTWWEVDQDGDLLVLFEGDLYEVVWSAGRGARAAELEAQLRDLLARHGCWFEPKNDTCITIYERESSSADE